MGKSFGFALFMIGAIILVFTNTNLVALWGNSYVPPSFLSYIGWGCFIIGIFVMVFARPKNLWMSR